MTSIGLVSISSFVKEVTPFISHSAVPQVFPSQSQQNTLNSNEIDPSFNSFPQVIERVQTLPFSTVSTISTTDNGTTPQTLSYSPPFTPSSSPCPYLQPSSFFDNSSTTTKTKKRSDHTGSFQREFFKLLRKKVAQQRWREFRNKRRCDAQRGACAKQYLAFCAKMGGEFAELAQRREFKGQGTRTKCACLKTDCDTPTYKVVTYKL